MWLIQPQPFPPPLPSSPSGASSPDDTARHSPAHERRPLATPDPQRPMRSISCRVFRRGVQFLRRYLRPRSRRIFEPWNPSRRNARLHSHPFDRNQLTTAVLRRLPRQAGSWSGSTHWSIERRVLVGFGLVFAGIVVISAISYRNTTILIENSQLDTKSHELVQLLGSVEETLGAAESSHRRYLVTGDESYLTSYRTVVERMPEYLRYLRGLTQRGRPNNRTTRQHSNSSSPGNWTQRQEPSPNAKSTAMRASVTSHSPGRGKTRSMKSVVS